MCSSSTVGHELGVPDKREPTRLTDSVVVCLLVILSGGEITFNKERLARARNKTPMIHEDFVTCVECGHRDHEICKLHLAWECPA
jgi:hypothetical protein